MNSIDIRYGTGLAEISETIFDIRDISGFLCSDKMYHLEMQTISNQSTRYMRLPQKRMPCLSDLVKKQNETGNWWDDNHTMYFKATSDPGYVEDLWYFGYNVDDFTTLNGICGKRTFGIKDMMALSYMDPGEDYF